MNVLLPLVLLGIGYCLLCIGTILFIGLNQLMDLVKKLDKPTREEIIGHMTMVEAQKERARISMIQEEQDERLAILIANKVGKAFSGKG